MFVKNGMLEHKKFLKESGRIFTQMLAVFISGE